MTVQPGAVLAGKYRVERVLGQGGMGVVVSAIHLQLDKRVALKFLRPEVTQNRELVARFSNEARAAGKIQSEHVAKVLDVSTLEDGAPYMVMEYLEGSDLAQVLRARGTLPGQDAIEYVLQACEALAEAHVAGIVHRDLKPANLFLTSRADGSPCIKVLDFGISKAALAVAEPGLTQTSAMLGSPSYMAPEQLRSARQVDARADIWALGITLHELLTGEVAFKGDTLAELHVSILQNPPEPLRVRRPEAPPGVEAILFRCLEKDANLRFANVGELAAALGEFAPPRARISVERISRIVAASGRSPGGPGHAAPPAGQSTPAPPYGAKGTPPGASYAYNRGHHDGAGSSPRPHAPSGPYYDGAGSGPKPQAPAGHYHPGPGAPHTPTPGYGPPGPSFSAPPFGAPPYQSQGYPLALGYGSEAAPAPRKGMHPSTIALIILSTLVVLGFGGCGFCVCLGAAAGNGGGRRADAARALPFQRPAGWTTLSPGEHLSALAPRADGPSVMSVAGVREGADGGKVPASGAEGRSFVACDGAVRQRARSRVESEGAVA